MLKFLWVFVATLVLTPSSFAEIFKCKGKDGLALYQNFPCDVDSLGTAPDRPADVKAAPAPKSIQIDTRNSVPAPSASGEPRVGMTAEEIRTLWGEPTDVLQDEPRSGRVEIWQYPDGRVVQINNKHRVISIQR